MSVLKKIKKRSLRKKLKNRSKIRCDYKNSKIRISIFRSLKNFYVQAIDDSKSITISSITSKNFNFSKSSMTKSEKSHELGLRFAEKLKSIDVTEAIFDRGLYVYHGRVKSFVDGLRDGSLKI